MAIEKFTTEAIVIALYDNGENDCMVRLYTREFGMIQAISKGLRKSFKLRAHIQPAHRSHITVVKGKEVYRIAGASEIYEVGDRRRLSYIAQLLNRFIHGEQQNTHFYDKLIEYLVLGDVDMSTFRLAVTVEMLISLGFVDIAELGLERDAMLRMTAEDMYIHAQLHKPSVVHIVSEAIKASML